MTQEEFAAQVKALHLIAQELEYEHLFSVSTITEEGDSYYTHTWGHIGTKNELLCTMSEYLLHESTDMSRTACKKCHALHKKQSK